MGFWADLMFLLYGLVECDGLWFGDVHDLVTVLAMVEFWNVLRLDASCGSWRFCSSRFMAHCGYGTWTHGWVSDEPRPKRGFGNSFQPAIDAPRLEPHELRHCPKRKDTFSSIVALWFYCLSLSRQILLEKPMRPGMVDDDFSFENALKGPSPSTMLLEKIET
ncbi:hypothetical protein LIER_16069 [Lithospermum erythrorhizon]|uniref:Uncharacterized protein n=1 Tax=Lithospermum erythrorhizon TaxID=34254 RepID=A0AAV3Q572_LITER